MVGAWAGRPSKNVRSHGWRSRSVTGMCRKERFLEGLPDRSPSPKTRIHGVRSSIQLRTNGHPSQRIRVGLDDFDIDKVANHLRILMAEVHNAVVLGTPRILPRVLLGQTSHQNPLSGTHHLAADIHHILVQAILQNTQPLLLHLHRRIVRQIRRRSTRAGAVDEAEGHIKADVVDQLHGVLEILIGFTREADNEVRREADVRADLAQAAQLGFVLQRRVAALHGCQDAVGAALHRQVQVADQFWYPLVDFDQGIAEFHRMGGGVANSVDAVDGGNHFDQLRQVHLVAVVGVTTIGVDVLAQKIHLAHALGSQVGHLGNHVVDRAADFFAAGVGHYAEGAVFAAAFHDRNERRRAVGTRFGQVVELLDFREADVDHAYAVTLHAHFADHVRQAVQGLRAEDHIHVGCPVDDGLAFLARDAAANADDQVGLFGFETFPAAKLVKHFLLSFFADGAGVQQQDVGVIRVVGHFNRFAGFEQVCHAGRVVLVHLAAVGFDEQLLGHGSHVVWCVLRRGVWRWQKLTAYYNGVLKLQPPLSRYSSFGSVL